MKQSENTLGDLPRVGRTSWRFVARLRELPSGATLPAASRHEERAPRGSSGELVQRTKFWRRRAAAGSMMASLFWKPRTDAV
jgi:hypothetical protein